MKSFFRIIALLEGVSYLLLMTLGLYFKYILSDDTYVKLLGMPHEADLLVYKVHYASHGSVALTIASLNANVLLSLKFLVFLVTSGN